MFELEKIRGLSVPSFVQILNNYWMRPSMILIIMQIEEGVIRRSNRRTGTFGPGGGGGGAVTVCPKKLRNARIPNS